ncbi:putative bifunctional purine Ade1 [Stachybotrys elegans]|uniref:phosphoribosylamine--glycine ligase n=1 Tax=Stachybotrys elegans TaxID=80388 RepID=A0A8K0SYC0_9HYPO|nr:putative bifunctional purine Ade1 [Stachybotrys elegans]
MKILLIGKGAREHALAWKLSQSPKVWHVYVVPGNGGTSRLDNVSNLDCVRADDYAGLVTLAKVLGVGLVVAGPDDAVVDGIEGYFRHSGILCFAPTKEAAEIEGSKAYSKGLMSKYGIPTAAYQSFTSYDEAQRYLDQVDTRVVIKADGLAAGKGVILPTNKTEAHEALHDIMVDKKFGEAGSSVIIEEFMEGDEISVLTFCDGKTFKSLPPGQDHKRIFDGNLGPNTGGMGVYAPLSFVTPEQMAQVDWAIIRPTLDAMRAEGRTFTGMLFTGVMLTSQGPKVIEYNARFGDPETQTMMMLLAPECDLVDILCACCTGSLDQISIPVLPGFACNVVIAAGGYPESYSKGDIVTIGQCPDGVQVFHAGTEESRDGTLRTAGGRVLSVASYGSSIEEAIGSAYRAVGCIKFDDMFFRTDIASRVLRRSPG